ncbi:hypothetical protein QCA50_006446 [Cerrena zonata]|uniref:Uncharacterized protein n=1 Tax=Cerrena zonata TaxID=2478898 RepID=A0AAW0GE27_9APHY
MNKNKYSSTMALAKVYGYVPTNEALLRRVKVKNLTTFNPRNPDSIIDAFYAALKDIISEAQLSSAVTIELIDREDLPGPLHAIALRNNWGRKGATDEEIARLKATLHTERQPGWFTLYLQK